MIVLEQPASLSVKPLKTISDLVTSIFLAERVLKEETNWKLLNPSLNPGLECVDKEDRDAGTGGYSFTKKPLLDYMDADSKRVCGVKERAKLYAWLGWICALLNQHRAKKEEGWITNSRG